MKPAGPWRELCRVENAHYARAIVTTIAAMEFPVRLMDATTGQVIEEREALTDSRYVIETHQDHRSELLGVLEEILDEQDEFDAAIEERDRFVLRARQIALVALIAIVAILAALRIINL